MLFMKIPWYQDENTCLNVFFEAKIYIVWKIWYKIIHKIITCTLNRKLFFLTYMYEVCLKIFLSCYQDIKYVISILYVYILSCTLNVIWLRHFLIRNVKVSESLECEMLQYTYKTLSHYASVYQKALVVTR